MLIIKAVADMTATDTVMICVGNSGIDGEGVGEGEDEGLVDKFPKA